MKAIIISTTCLALVVAGCAPNGPNGDPSTTVSPAQYILNPEGGGLLGLIGTVAGLEPPSQTQRRARFIEAFENAQPACEEVGYVPDTEPWFDCVLGVTVLLADGPTAPNPYADRAQCRALGLVDGTLAFASCVTQQGQTRALNRAAEAQDRAAEAQERANRRPRITVTQDQGLSFLCKDAIMRGDSGGTFVHC